MTPIEQLMSAVEWKALAPSTGDLPYATHEGVFDFGGLKLRCYRLNDGRAIFNADDFRAAFGELLGVSA